jgi:hypothetical protein
MSYDTSKNFSGNKKAAIKDQFNFSPAQDCDYNYRKDNNIIKINHLNGVMTEPKNMYTPGETRKMSKMARYEQD